VFDRGPSTPSKILVKFGVSKWSISVKFKVFEGLGPSNRTILGKRQPPFFTASREIDPNSTIFGLSLGSKYDSGLR